jgi:putative inorganic carbon (HCO3(-)) transporter
MKGKFYWVYLIGFFLILVLPLLNLPPWFSPPDWGKTIVFRIVLSILLFFFILQKTQINADKTDLCRYGLPFWLLIGLLGIFFLATIFSLDRNFSFWGSPYRSGGFLNFAFYIIFAILAFLIIKDRDWQKIWDFAIFIGILVSLVAIFQWKGLFSQFLIPFSGRPPSTVGGPIFLAIYLLLLTFLTLSFLIKERNWAKKFFYLISLFLFVFVAVFITVTRAAIIGLAIGFLYFLFFYPSYQHRVLIILSKALVGIILILGIYGIYYLNTAPQFPKFIQENRILMDVASRVSIKAGLTDPRISGWKVAKQAIMERPILGYGPENFSIGFDKYYDPALPGIEKSPYGVTSWWDRAHNFVFDIGVTAGIPALIIYLLLFGVLFWQLQKLKSLIPHALQATFIGYLVANFFSFDTFSTYLISFLLIGYSFHLIAEGTLDNTPKNAEQFSVNQHRHQREISDKSLLRRTYLTITKWKKLILAILLVILLWFIWVFNIKPFLINKEINWASYESREGYHEKALVRMENLLAKRSFLDDYLRLKYIEIIGECLKKNPELTLPFSEKAVEILKENVKIRPYYTRNWLLLGSYANILLEKAIQAGKEIQSEEVQNLKQEANSYFEKANQLSPKRQEIFTEWIRTDLLTGEYEKAETKAQTCIDLNEKLEECYWLMGLSQAGLKNIEKSDYYLKIAGEKGFNTQSKNSLYELIRVYIDTKNYRGLVETFSKLIEIEPQNPQHHASLATAYRELGNYEMAKKEALKVLELQPEAKEEVERFLRELP